MSPVVKIVQPCGILDRAKAEPLRKDIINQVENGADIVVVDLQNVAFMDSSGLAALVLALKTVTAGGSQMWLVLLNEQVKTLFELTSMDRVFKIYANRDDFNQAMLSTK